MNITVVGLGYVGTSLSVLLSTKHKVTALDINKARVEALNNRVSYLSDSDIAAFLNDKTLNLTATLNKEEAYTNADFIIIATPTDYDDNTNTFNIESVEAVLTDINKHLPTALVIIKSTLPLGGTEALQAQFPHLTIIFSPEFLREHKALHDNLYPARIVVGETSKEAHAFAALLQDIALNNPPVIFTNSKEAEAIKLFANTYLAMRVSFFNELDTFAELYNLDTQNIIKAVSLDPRIGDFYNNPSFGYGGYCLPKDTKQMAANFKDVPSVLINATVEANAVRKQHIADMILKRNPRVIGVYRLVMKKASSNTRESSIFGVLDHLKDNNIRIIIYEPTIKSDKYEDYVVIKDLDTFKKQSDIIIANRMHSELNDVHTKVYTRDIFNRD